MEIISLDAKLFNELLENIKAFVEEYEKNDETIDYSLEKWLDNQDVCQILNISKRTLQGFRDTGKFAYSRIDNKIYYKPQDVKLFIDNYRTEKTK